MQFYWNIEEQVSHLNAENRTIPEWFGWEQIKKNQEAKAEAPADVGRSAL